MPEACISDIFNTPHRYLRAVHLERDFGDPKSLEGYVVTEQTRHFLHRLTNGLKKESGQRAWRITGDYGAGKSSFALLLAHLFSGQNQQLPGKILHSVSFEKLGISRPRMVPILVTGSSEPLRTALLRAFLAFLRNLPSPEGRSAISGKIQAELRRIEKGSIADGRAVRLILDATADVVVRRRGSGVLIIIDELGKFLEYAALHPDQQDVYLLQALAEASARSGSKPLFLVGLLHEGFQAYSEHLSPSAQREWEKVAGRFEELLFDQPLEDAVALIAEALNVQDSTMPQCVISRSRRAMKAMLDVGWYGPGVATKRLTNLAERIYPLHPSVIPVLVRLFNRFGQNERSLFSFLLSNEPFGLQDFARRPLGDGDFYRIHNLYDYARSTFGYRLSLQSFRSHWNHIESMVGSFVSDQRGDVEVLKTIGLLNLLDTSSFIVSEDAVELCVAAEKGHSRANVRTAVRRLRSRHALYQLGPTGGYCLWPFTSINLDKAYQDASRAVDPKADRVSEEIKEYLDSRPLVARRHYIETGNLRHFEVHYCSGTQLEAELKFDSEVADGRIVIPLCETPAEREEIVNFILTTGRRAGASIIWAVPNPLRALDKLLTELQRWEWVAENTIGLANDSFGTEEVSRQIAGARQALLERLRTFLGLRHFGGSELEWYQKGSRLQIRVGRELLSYLSDICDEVYPQAPRVRNELINRRSLSSAAAAARMRLIEDIFTGASQEYLGMNPAKKPPEMSIYLSLLKESCVHVKEGNKWVLRVPEKGKDICNLRPSLDRILRVLTDSGMRRVSVATVLCELRKPPYGIREGLAPVLFAIFAAINEHHLAFYENETFMPEIVGLDLMRLTKLPGSFDVQFFSMDGIRLEQFNELLKVIGANATRKERLDVLEIVRPLCVFAAKLPPYTHRTRRLSAIGAAVRTALLGAREPATLLFRDLPSACGFPEFSGHGKHLKEVRGFMRALKCALNEIRLNYTALLERMKVSLGGLVELDPASPDFRQTLAQRALGITWSVTEVQLTAFCNRLSDTELPDLQWVESLGSLVSGVPPSRWQDGDEDRFHEELAALCARFKRVESLTFGRRTNVSVESALRMTITKLDGSEMDQVVHLSPEDEDAAGRAEAAVAAILSEGKAGLAGTLRALWKGGKGKEIDSV